MTPTTSCRCGQPTRDNATFCDTCADLLARDLGEIPWLAEQLAISGSRTRGLDYRRNIGGKGPKKPSERPLPVHLGASKVESDLKALLVSWVRLCWEEGVRHRETTNDLPEDTIPALSRWLICRVDGLQWHPAGGDAVDEFAAIVRRSYGLIDRPADKWFAGPCEECKADMYALAGAVTVPCEACGLIYDLAERREWLLTEAREHHATASEIARAVIVWGQVALPEARMLVRICRWSEKSRIQTSGHVVIRGVERPLYRVGDVLDLLQAEAVDAQKKSRRAA